ncbi:CCAAT/enhancer-binding protein zeta [Oopsacas minuta]|uniref:CCAAT/enhancer-binding protein zeta n=1 Tax=Oopsacas minuta TaxID=111878 RepID=A0AAV7K8H6_9METZ|nr:CCAAT/enhancer-binding protein zeta [Oopsacas minuta]
MAESRDEVSQNELLEYMSNIGLKQSKIVNKSIKPQKLQPQARAVKKIKLSKTSPKRFEKRSVVAIKTPLVTNDSMWFEVQRELYQKLNITSGDNLKVPDLFLKEAEELISRDTAAYKSVQEKINKSDTEWIRSILVTGTLSDKLSAHVLLVQESPIHNLTSLSALLNLAAKNEKRVALNSCDSLRQLWTSSLLPDRKLIPLGQYYTGLKSLKSSQDRDRSIILALFEHKLRHYYLGFINLVKRYAHDTVLDVKTKSIDYLFEMLAMKPEQEQILLTALVDKLADPSKKIASKAQYLLFKLNSRHPNMKYVVCEEVERLVNRTSISEKAQYYGFNFLNQIILSRGDVKLANKLILIYFTFFRVYSKKNEANWKVLSSLLSGVQRAYPFSELKDDELFSKQIDMLFKIVHVGTFSTSLQSLLFLFQLIETKPQITVRFHQVLYNKMYDRELVSSNKHALFLNLIFRTFKGDSVLIRNKAYVKRLLQSTIFHKSNYLCAVLKLCEMIFQHDYTLKSLITQPVDRDSEDENFKDLSSSNEESDGNHTPVKSLSSAPRYYSNCRNPLYSHADYSCLWEISLIGNHYHPSARSFAENLLCSKKSEFSGDPLECFSFTSFLDKFVYKSPKQKETGQGISLMQKLTSKQRPNKIPVNSPAFLSLKPDCIPEDEVFYYQYFKLQERKLSKQRENSEKLLQDDEDLQPDRELTPNFMGDLKKKFNKRRCEQSEYSSSSNSEIEDFDMDGSDFDSSEDVGFNEEKYEKMLIRDVKSDEERQGEGSIDDRLFAAADEFSHLIEDGIYQENQDKNNTKRKRYSIKSAANKLRRPSPKLKTMQKSKKNAKNSFGKQNFGKSFKKLRN